MTMTTHYQTIGPEKLPEIDCVVIGVNAQATLHRCLMSILQCNYPEDLINVIYVDGGSFDDSISIAETLPGIRIVRLNPEHPTPGLGRNAGWKSGHAPLVQFLDSDTVLDENWFRKAVKAFKPDTAAVAGNRIEMHPEQSVYNWIASLEWNGGPGDVESFGGDVLVRREVLEKTNGYDEELVGGEDPELSLRIRLSGWRITQLDIDMTRHDLAMTNVSQYWKRAYRSGYAFAAVIDRHADQGTPFWRTEFRRIINRGGGFLAFSFMSLLPVLIIPRAPYSPLLALTLLATALLLLFYPRLFRVPYFMQDKKLDRSQAQVYAWHCSLVVLPDIFGVARFYLGKAFNRPLRNKRSKLVTLTLQSEP